MKRLFIAVLFCIFGGSFFINFLVKMFEVDHDTQLIVARILSILLLIITSFFVRQYFKNQRTRTALLDENFFKETRHGSKVHQSEVKNLLKRKKDNLYFGLVNGRGFLLKRDNDQFEILQNYTMHDFLKDQDYN